jgi:hypothetical protein
VSIEKIANDSNTQSSDVEVSKKALWRLFMDLVRALAIASIAYGLIDPARRALVS